MSTEWVACVRSCVVTAILDDDITDDEDTALLELLGTTVADDEDTALLELLGTTVADDEDTALLELLGAALLDDEIVDVRECVSVPNPHAYCNPSGLYLPTRISVLGIFNCLRPA